MMIRNIFKSDIVKNISVLSLMTAIAQVIPFLAQIYLRRVIPKPEFGIYAVFLAISSITVIISTLRYEMAIVIPKRNKDAANVMALSIIISLAINLLLFIAIVFFHSKIIELLNWDDRYGYWLWLIPLASFLFSSYLVVNFWLIRKKAFFGSGLNRVLRRTGEAGVQSGFGTVGGLLAGDIVGRVLMLISGYVQAVRKGFTVKYLRIKRMRYAAKRYNKFPRFQALPALLNTASLMIPVLIVNEYFGDSITSQFDLSRQILVVPLVLISTAMSQVLFQKFSELRNRGLSVKKPLLQSSLMLSFISVPAIILMVFFSEPIFAFIYGEQYRISGSYASILVFAYMIQFIVSPVSILLIALEKIKIAALWQVLYFCAIASFFFIEGLTIWQFIKIFTIINVIAYSVYWIMIYRVAILNERKVT
jgi:O-antigen/teichoic acid export membrane protein